jgi:hypothetical protein
VLSTTLVDDYAASTATTGVVPIGGSTTGDIETTNDRRVVLKNQSRYPSIAETPA